MRPISHEFATNGAVTLFGSILMAYIFGEIAVLISNFYARSSRYQAKMEYLFETMNRMGLPAEIEKRVYSYYEYIHEAHGTTDGRTTAFVPELSKKLAAEVLMYMRMEMIHRVPFFNAISPEVVQQVSARAGKSERNQRAASEASELITRGSLARSLTVRSALAQN